MYKRDTMLVTFNDCIIPGDGLANNSNIQAYQCFDIHIITIVVCVHRYKYVIL